MRLVKNRFTIGFFITLFLIGNNLFSQQHKEGVNDDRKTVSEECTIGVANGSATSDGRPLLWKTRDYSDDPDNELKYVTTYPIPYIGVCSAGTSTYPWMGVNKYGFAILNSASTDLPAGSTGPGNGDVMRWALGNCRTVDDFEDYLNSTNITGRTTQANFGVIDSTGTAVIYETADNEYWKYDAANATNGYVVRTNFAMNGGGEGGIERYNRTKDLIHSFYSGDSLNYKSILRYQMRDFSDFDSQPVPVPFPDYWISGRPYGYIYSYVSICRSTTVSASVIHGVLPTELAGLTTMWTILGHPATSVALPYWPVGIPPVEADGPVTSSLCDVSRDIRSYLYDYPENINYIDSYKLLDGSGGGLWTKTFPLEDSIMAATENAIDIWRSNNPLPVASMLTFESDYTSYALQQLQSFYLYLDNPQVEFGETIDITVYPNPAGKYLNVNYRLSRTSRIRMEICSITGAKIVTLTDKIQPAGEYTYQLNLKESGYPDGIYLLTILIDNQRYTYRIIKTS